MRLIITSAISAAMRKSLWEGRTDINKAERNCPLNIAMVPKLICSPLLAAVLLLTIRLLNSGVEKPNPMPMQIAAVHNRCEPPQKKYWLKPAA